MTLPSAGIIDNIIAANVDFSKLGPWLDSVYDTVITNTTILGIWDTYVTSNAFLSVNLKLILLACALFVAFFGRKFANPIRFIATFVVAFCLSICYISPIFAIFASMPQWVIPLIIASICAILCRYIYMGSLTVCVIYPIYCAIMSPVLSVPFVGGNKIAAIIIAVVSFILFLIFRKHIERFGYSFLGGFFAAEIIRRFYDYTSLLPEYSTLLILALTLIIAIAGFIFQEKTSKKRCNCDCHN